MDSVMIHQHAKWNCNSTRDEMMMTVPPPSPQDTSLLETVFSNHLSAKMHTQQPNTMNSYHHSAELHAKKLNGLLLHHKRRNKRPSHIPILSSRIIRKKTNKQQQEQPLVKAFERIYVSDKEDKKKKDKVDIIVQELNDMGL